MNTEQFKEIISQYSNIDASELKDELRFREDLNFSSLDFMAFLGELEDTFDIEVDETEALKITTIGEAVEYFQSVIEK